MGLFDPYSPALNAVIIYIILIIILVLAKPNFIYNYKEQKFREFGNGYDQTYFTLPVVSIILAILLYYIFVFVEESNYYSDKYRLRRRMKLSKYS